MYTLLSDVTNTPTGLKIVADVACILSPLYPDTPVPATLVITPVANSSKNNIKKNLKNII